MIFRLNMARMTYLAMLSLLYAIAASQAIWSFAYKWTTIESHRQYSLEKTIEGSSPKPYAYRLLVPEVINSLVDVIPPRFARPFTERARITMISAIGNQAFRMSERLVLAYGLVLLIGFFLLMGTMFLLRKLSRDMLPSSYDGASLVYDISPILFALLLSVSYRAYNGFVYDHFELFALVAYLFFAKEQQNLAAFVVLMLAILNKETAIFFPLFGMIIRQYKNPQISLFRNKSSSAIEVLAVLLVFMAVRIYLQDHPGTATEWHFHKNMAFWFSPGPWFALTTPHLQVVPLPKPSNLLMLVPVLVIILGYWKRKPITLKALFLVSLSINIPLFVLFVYHDEFRNLSLMFPFLFLLATHSILEFFQGASSDQKEPNR